MYKQEFVHNCDIPSIFGFSIGGVFFALLVIAALIGVGAMGSEGDGDSVMGLLFLAIIAALICFAMWWGLVQCA